MSLQQTALQIPADAGAEWVLDGKVQEGQPAAAITLQPNQDQPLADASPQEPAPLTDLDRVAQELGWTPQDQWRGDPAKWASSAEFLRATGRVLERTKQDLKLTRRQTDELNARLARVELGQQSLAQQRQQELFQQYEDAKFEASKAGDRATWDKLVAEQQTAMASFQQNDPAAAPRDVYAQAEQIMSDPIAARFFEANPVALQDDRAWALMDREMSRVAQSGGGAAAQFRAAEEALRYAYAQAYERPGTGEQQGIPQQRGQDQPRDPGGRFVSPQQQAPQRRPAPPMNAASPVANANQTASVVDRLDGEARAFLAAQVAKGAVKDQERWARVYLGEKISPIAGARA